MFVDRKTKLLPLSEVPRVLRACGLTIFGEQEKTIKQEVEKIDGLGKPVSFKTLSDWMEENQSRYSLTYGAAYDSLGTLCYEGIVGNTSGAVQIHHLRHIVTNVGDKVTAGSFATVHKELLSDQKESVPLDDLLAYLRR
jgi:Ca2+-binding EF-hand superfamily protein